MESGERRGFGGFEDHGISAGEGGGNFPRQHQQREIPRDDLSRHPERPRGAAGEGISQLVRPAGIIEKMGGDQWEVDVPALADRLASIHRFQHRQFAGFFLDQAGDAEEIFTAIRSRGFGPDLFIGAAGGSDGAVHVRSAGFRNAGEWFFRGGIDGFEGPATGGTGPFPINKQPIFRPDQGFDGLRGGRVVPAAGEVEGRG